MQLGIRIVVIALSLWVGGCAYFMSDLTKVDMRIVAGGDVNPDDNGRPSPVVVRVVELKSPSVFESAEFFALYQNEAQTLGSDLVATEEFEFKPGDVQDLKFALKPESNYVGVLAAYRQLEKANWRLVLPLAIKEKNELTVLLNQRGIELATPR
ncbi:MAG: type VI secretion system lipoprotein TssJ [Pseudomonadales bacterium]|jgi:type VI secretion system protein VasD|uniref:type VI secretion system lipoprotein TssJ n=1 Tax=unclassified Ketobacter TaxID=2639109 RepID=UPI000C484A03|nr:MULTISPECIES: type VI secretion system lipoprotein TssJ [unclassified Ketobacter]MAQ23783.1 type VI secretion system lipoprotein TssJ [Pseudomonadales bacterium]MEC8810303.1 type VI secretion system lipoprotein TssJ [Pseudomonadota bacterium]HAU15259.1 type VI secretion system lipoprotein TssJ [Gammaproteobacteria bacterium]MBI26232.1 type VI secretion system lipoprotein TssJ [Pseudomonadales bacterium]RLT89639.1 MAG: type VI secretion system lipoprotein TssJ [Ketobacter sp. GenoA1]|tara:strand:+ start:2828 stop:3289 length:462 start_codon:yes stop_codon:yes gene_type:complete